MSHARFAVQCRDLWLLFARIFGRSGRFTLPSVLSQKFPQDFPNGTQHRFFVRANLIPSFDIHAQIGMVSVRRKTVSANCSICYLCTLFRPSPEGHFDSLFVAVPSSRQFPKIRLLLLHLELATRVIRGFTTCSCILCGMSLAGCIRKSLHILETGSMRAYCTCRLHEFLARSA